MEMIIKQLPHLVVLMFSIVVHEVSHGYVALRRGDTTARDAGRLTLNPLPHVDIFGTIILPLILMITSAGFLFGFAKPVPINPRMLRDPKKDMALIGAAGPFSNIVLAVIAGIIFRITQPIMGDNNLLVQTLGYAAVINVILAVFNLIPIPPLDGSRIIMGLLPTDLAVKYIKLERYGMFIIFGLIMLGAFNIFLMPIVRFLLLLILG